MEQIAENTADSLTESVKEVNQFTQYFQGKMPGLMDLGIKLVIVLIAFFVCRKIIQLILKIFGRSFERAGMEAASAHFTLSIMKAIMYVMVVAVMATFLGVSGASVAALIGSMGVGVVLALKESLSNIAGGFILLFMKPFVSGDYIHEDTHGNEGTVVKVDLFYTTLLTIDNRTVSIPNGIITNSSLTNISKQDKRQLREKVGVMYGNPETTTGGRALKFYATMRMDVRRVESIKSGDDFLGNRTKVKIVKNKVAPPFKQAEFDIMYGEGISKEGDVLDCAIELKVIDKAGSWYSFEGDRIGQGRENVKKYMLEHPEMMERVEELVRDTLKKDSDKTDRSSEEDEKEGDLFPDDFEVDEDGVIIE